MLKRISRDLTDCYGKGLGLAIVKHIAEIHNADIELDGKPGIGTEISVHFPEISRD